MPEIAIYIAIGICAGFAQYILDDHDLWKVPVVALLWPAILCISLFLGLMKWADE